MQRKRKIQTTIQLPPDLLEQMDAVKITMGSSRNFIIERALRMFFDKDIETRLKKKE